MVGVKVVDTALEAVQCFGARRGALERWGPYYGQFGGKVKRVVT